MITYPGYDDVIQRALRHGQRHLFTLWNDCDDSEKKRLLDDIAAVDFDLLSRLYRQAAAPDAAMSMYEPAPYIALPHDAASHAAFSEARDKGIDHIKKGKAAAFVVAGGQGSRLGFDGPKGIFPVGPVTGKSLFQIHAEKILKYAEKYGVSIPWLVMTSQANHEATAEYLKSRGRFGLDEKDVILFAQNMIPSLDTAGKLILESKCSIFKNPDGHGGSLTALASSGALAEVDRRGIDVISYFQVDNPLVNIIDPVFIGFHVTRNANVSSKGLMKAYPEEKIGVFVKFEGGEIGVIEYSDLPEKLQNSVDATGRLSYCMGSIAIHLFSVPFIKTITDGSGVSLPFHIARKKIAAYGPDGIAEIDGFKFEKFVFDALPLTDRNIVLEIRREDEFAPVKNKTGVDSLETAQELMVNQHRQWLEKSGVQIPPSAKIIEISPLRAVDAGDITGGITLPDEERIYLE